MQGCVSTSGFNESEKYPLSINIGFTEIEIIDSKVSVGTPFITGCNLKNTTLFSMFFNTSVFLV
ncbi:MAG: hypothetical protein IJ937_04230 [Treponema sp.]|nr:hypothetical protein [Treponema sp.]